MNLNDYQNQMMKFENSRKNLFGVIIFTAVNLALAFLKANMYFLFSATIPLAFFYNGWAVGSLVIIGIYVACWYFMEKIHGLILVPLVLFLLDCLFYALLIIGDISDGYGFDYQLIIDIVFHVFIMFYLISGTIAWIKIRKVNPQELLNDSAETAQVSADVVMPVETESATLKDNQETEAKTPQE